MYTLRKYQSESVEAGLRFFEKAKPERGGLLVEPTGSGKSLVIANIARELSDPVLVFQPSKEILEQNLAKIHDYGFDDVGVFSASVGRKDLGHVTFATIGSVNNLPEAFDHVKHIIVDEAHGVNARGGMYADFAKRLGVPVLGLTATPYRLHSYEDFKSGERSVVAKFLHRTRPRLFHELLHVTQISTLFDEGYLCPVEYIENDDYKHSEIKLNSTGADFDQKALKEYNEKKNIVQTVYEAIATHKAKHVLVFCVFVAEAEALATQLREIGVSSESVSADTKPKERERILNGFKSGEIRVVTNVGVLTTGFDFPALDSVILARPTQSVALYYQMVGRGIRTAEGKSRVKVIDVCGNVARFGKVENFDIVGEKGKERLKSDTSYLTGYDFVANVDLEARDYEGMRETTGENNSKIWLVGKKHAGKHITKVPTDYLNWVIDNFSNGSWKNIAMREVERRLLNDARRGL